MVGNDTAVKSTALGSLSSWQSAVPDKSLAFVLWGAIFLVLSRP